MTMRRSILPLFCGAALLSGCNLAPKHVQPIGAVPDSLPQGGIYPPSDQGAPDISSIAWRDFFADPKLQAVIALGLDNNRDLRIAAANVLQARAQYRAQRANILPTLDLTASHNSSRAPSPTVSGQTVRTDNFSAGIGISAFEIDLFGRLRNLSRSAFEQYLATSEAQRAVQISLIAEIASAYLTLAADEELLLIAKDTLTSFGATLDLTQSQFRLGVASELDVRQADTAYQDARDDVAALHTQIAQDRNALDLLTGSPVGSNLLPAPLADKNFVLEDLPANLSSTVLLARPDIIAAEHTLLAEEANIGAARAAMFPTIALTAAFGGLSDGLSNLFDEGSETWSVTPSLSIPLFDFGRRRANLRFAEASRQAAIASYEKALQTAFREVADALALRGTITNQVDAREKGAASAFAAAAISQARYKAGVDPFLVTLISQRTAFGAAQNLVGIRLARIQNLIQLYRSLGGGLK